MDGASSISGQPSIELSFIRALDANSSALKQLLELGLDLYPLTMVGTIAVVGATRLSPVCLCSSDPVTQEWSAQPLSSLSSAYRYKSNRIAM